MIHKATCLLEEDEIAGERMWSCIEIVWESSLLSEEQRESAMLGVWTREALIRFMRLPNNLDFCEHLVESYDDHEWLQEKMTLRELKQYVRSAESFARMRREIASGRFSV